MSQRALNGQQFQQLPMFMPTSEIIDTVRKPDSALAGLGHTPREEWEAPGSSPWGGDESLRDEKLSHSGVRSSTRGQEPRTGYADMLAKGDTPPVTIFHEPDDDVLYDGHHRLAYLERAGHTEIPVEHLDEKHPW
jgi:hypothetical protein